MEIKIVSHSLSLAIKLKEIITFKKHKYIFST